MMQKAEGQLCMFYFTQTCAYGIKLMQVCYVAFWDDITLVTQKEQGHKVGENHFIGKWRIIIVKDLPFTDQRLNGKIPKVWKYLVS